MSLPCPTSNTLSNEWDIAQLANPALLDVRMAKVNGNKKCTHIETYQMKSPNTNMYSDFCIRLQGNFSIPVPDKALRNPSISINITQQPMGVCFGIMGILATFFRQADKVIEKKSPKIFGVLVSPGTWAKEEDPESGAIIYSDLLLDSEQRFYEPNTEYYRTITQLITRNPTTNELEYIADPDSPSQGMPLEKLTKNAYFTFYGEIITYPKILVSVISSQMHIKLHLDPTTINIHTVLANPNTPMLSYFREKDKKPIH